MTDWRNVLNGDPSPWLLEPNNPSVRYFTLTDILDRAATDSEVQEAKAAIMDSAIVREIFAAQHPDGYWKKKGTGYFPQYKGTLWQLVLLAELGVDGEDERVQRGCEQVLTGSLRSNGDFTAFSFLGWKIPSPVPNTCLPGSLIRAFLRFGYDGDRRVAQAIERLAERCRDTEWICLPAKPNPCLWGVVKALSAFAELPADARSSAVKETKRCRKMSCKVSSRATGRPKPAAWRFRDSFATRNTGNTFAVAASATYTMKTTSRAWAMWSRSSSRAGARRRSDGSWSGL